MDLRIFDVEHGQCSLLTTASGGQILIDCGHNSTSGWRPSAYLQSNGIDTIDRLFITNSDEDHASDLANVRRVACIKSLIRNSSVTSQNIRQLKSQSVGSGIEELCKMLDAYVHPAAANPMIDSLVYKSFCNKYPDDFEDENNLSVVTSFDVGNLKICFTGDMTSSGFMKLLQRADFVSSYPKLRSMLHHTMVEKTGVAMNFIQLGN